uniref:F-box domain-containing protein n=1 Tax=Salix viminalis TaxID=40686 RepID=A0A6N2LKD0_SALVM
MVTEGKRRGELPSSTTITLNNVTVRMDDLTDDLLLGILLRLPTAKSAIRCMLVCKRWCSLIPTRSFITRFKTHHTSEKKKFCDYDAAYQCPPSVFMRTEIEDQEVGIILLTPNVEFEENLYTLEFLPEEEKFVAVKASCDDLLLCLATDENYNATNQYICNPFTEKWLLLPPPPKRISYTPRDDSAFSGLVCEPNSPRRDVQGQEYEVRFRVLQFTPISELDAYMDVYCSETGQWNEFILSGRQYDSFLNVVAFDGKLHWYNGSDVVAYDPFNDGQTIFIDGSEIVLSRSDPWINRSECLGTCQGFLRYMRLQYATVGDDDDNLSVWELRDYESRRMTLTSKILFDNIICKDPDLRHVSMSSLRMFAPKAAAFHPSNKDVVCLFLFPHFIFCNIQSGEFEIIMLSLYEKDEYSFKVLPIALPWWPTPVSTIP